MIRPFFFAGLGGEDRWRDEDDFATAGPFNLRRGLGDVVVACRTYGARDCLVWLPSPCGLG
jgi:hypothetical protein